MRFNPWMPANYLFSVHVLMSVFPASTRTNLAPQMALVFLRNPRVCSSTFDHNNLTQTFIPLAPGPTFGSGHYFRQHWQQCSPSRTLSRSYIILWHLLDHLSRLCCTLAQSQGPKFSAFTNYVHIQFTTFLRIDSCSLTLLDVHWRTGNAYSSQASI
jgi:hypothetical protein